jgi:hypothetical protein
MIRMHYYGEAAVVIALLVAWMVPRGSAQTQAPAANTLDPKVLAYKLPDQIPWKDDPIGAKMAVLQGDPSKPGLYIVLVKWTPNHMSHPHWHPNDRFITVISGTWWVGTGQNSILTGLSRCPRAASSLILENKFTTTVPKTPKPSSRSSVMARQPPPPPKKNNRRYIYHGRGSRWEDEELSAFVAYRGLLDRENRLEWRIARRHGKRSASCLSVRSLKKGAGSIKPSGPHL